MQNIIIQKCTKDYELIKISASQLDEWKGIGTEEQQERAMELGDMFHDIILSSLYCKEKSKYIFQYHLPDISSSQRERIQKCIKASEKLPELMLIEQKKRITIEFGKYKVLFSCKFDGMYIDKRPVIVDVKSSAHKWINVEEKIQLKCYGFVHGVDRVEYRIYPKIGFDDVQVLTFELNPKHNRIEVINSIIQYLKDNYLYEGKFLSIEN